MNATTGQQTNLRQETAQQPSSAFVIASWLALGTGAAGFLGGLWKAPMGIEEKGYYFAVLALGLFAAISVQKSVRDRLERIPVSNLYLGICWLATVVSVGLLAIGLYNATTIVLEVKGFFAMAFALCMFAVITVQKNTRDTLAHENQTIDGSAVEPEIWTK